VKSNRPICRGCDKQIVHDVLMVTMPGHKKAMPMCTRCAAKAARGCPSSTVNRSAGFRKRSADVSIERAPYFVARDDR
jgi:hypothetical protein